MMTDVMFLHVSSKASLNNSSDSIYTVPSWTHMIAGLVEKLELSIRLGSSLILVLGHRESQVMLDAAQNYMEGCNAQFPTLPEAVEDMGPSADAAFVAERAMHLNMIHTVRYLLSGRLGEHVRSNKVEIQCGMFEPLTGSVQFMGPIAGQTQLLYPVFTDFGYPAPPVLLGNVPANFKALSEKAASHFGESQDDFGVQEVHSSDEFTEGQALEPTNGLEVAPGNQSILGAQVEMKPQTPQSSQSSTSAEPEDHTLSTLEFEAGECTEAQAVEEAVQPVQVQASFMAADVAEGEMKPQVSQFSQNSTNDEPEDHTTGASEFEAAESPESGMQEGAEQASPTPLRDAEEGEVEVNEGRIQQETQNRAEEHDKDQPQPPVSRVMVGAGLAVVAILLKLSCIRSFPASYVTAWPRMHMDRDC